MADIYKRFANLTKKRDAVCLRITKLQEELELLDADIVLLQKELVKHGLLRDLQPADVT